MLAKRIIPCLDVKDGRVVKGINFLNLKDAGDPVEQAALYSREGADEVVFLDITASDEHRKTMLDVVRRTAEEVFIPFTVGGGIRSLEDIELILRHGADKISLNTAAALSQRSNSSAHQLMSSRANSHPLSKLSWEVYIYGGKQPAGIDVIEWVKRVEKLGAGEILLTSMDRDGTQIGYDIELTRAVSEAIKIPVIASGGAGTLEHLYDALSQGKADAVLAASIFHYGTYTIKQTKNYLIKKGLNVRLDKY
ncbi:MAG: imidazole glycerol phosphate synthase subunit HisF [Candidatus Omnitrophica bacterium]|nr:imidazole glycerol phosphate synthase subunit HisF [Candidatus Omnitrophota bacterium]